MTNVVRGGLIAESLRIGAPLDIEITVRRITRADVGDVDAGQPRTWTFIDFEVPAGQVDALMSALSDALETRGGWYCDFRSADETFVVFAGRVFRYPRGERTGRAEAAAYARTVGVPESQLDWPE